MCCKMDQRRPKWSLLSCTMLQHVARNMLQHRVLCCAKRRTAVYCGVRAGEAGFCLEAGESPRKLAPQAHTTPIGQQTACNIQTAFRCRQDDLRELSARIRLLLEVESLPAVLETTYTHMHRCCACQDCTVLQQPLPDAMYLTMR